EWADVDGGAGFRRIHLLCSGNKDELDASGLEHAEVARFVARVGLEVFVRPELGGVNEDADRNACVLGRRLANKGEVACVEEAHCRDKAESAGKFMAGRAEIGNRPEDF